MRMKHVLQEQRLIRPPWRLALPGATAAATCLAVAALWTTAPESHAAPVPPHGVVAANLDVVVNTFSNNAGSVTVTPVYAIGDFRTRPTANNGDYDIQIGEIIADDITNGVLITSPSQNGRNLGHPTYPGTNYVTTHLGMGNAGVAGGYWIPVCLTYPNSLGTGVVEYDMNVAAAWFPYDQWIAGYAHYSAPATMNNTTLDALRASPGLVLGTHFIDVGSARYTLDLRSLGIDSRTNGVILVLGAKNEDNYALSWSNPTNGTWTIQSKDNGTDGAGGEQDPIAFVYVDKTNTGAIAGKFQADGTILIHSGNTPQFTVTNIDWGRWELKLKGLTPAHGVLLVSPEGGQFDNQDNIVSYEVNAAGDGWIIESRDLPAMQQDDGSFLPPLESPGGGFEPVASFAFILGVTPGFTVTPTNNLQTSETGNTADFTVALETKPRANVSISLTSSDTTEGTVAPASLTFTPENWDQPQQVTVSGVDDALEDGPVAFNIVLGAATSADDNYAGLVPPVVRVLNTDSEVGITVTPTGGLTVQEAGGTATFDVQLNTQPTADVTISLSSSDTTEGTVAPASLTFTSGNWNFPQSVTITGVDDGVDDGDTQFTIVTGAATSADAAYNGKAVLDVTVTTIDDDTMGVSVTPTALSILEGLNGTYTVALGSQPTADVVVTVTSGNPSAGPASPGTLTFTPQNWSTPREVTVTAVGNLVGGGDVIYRVTNTLASADAAYAALDPDDVTVTLLDDEATLTLGGGGEVLYGTGMAGVGVASRATVSDPLTQNYDTGTLTAALTGNGTPDDRIEIRNDGSGPGQIGVAGNEVSYENIVIGTFAGGTGTTPLTVTLNNAATPAAAQALLRAVTFRNVSANPSPAPRTVTLSLADVDGGAGTVMTTVRVGAVRVSEFQQGVDSGYGVYTDAADAEITQLNPDVAYPRGHNNNALWIDAQSAAAQDACQVLLRFDNIIGNGPGQIPTNAVIVEAELYLTAPADVSNAPGDASPLYRMLVPWDAEAATWNNVGTGNSGFVPDDVYVRSTYDSFFGLPNGDSDTGTGTFPIGVTDDLKAWVSGATNYGWVMPGWPSRTDGTALATSEDANLEERPRLRVLWVPAGTETASFRQGVNEYYSSFDTRLRADTPDIDGGSLTSVFIDWTGSTDHALIRFDDIIGTEPGRIPPGSQIHAAMLDLSSMVGNGMGDGGQFYAMLRPWDQYDTWNMADNGITADGVEAASTPTFVAGNQSRAPNVQAAFHSFDVTSDLQAWANGVRTNYGWAGLPWPNGGDGWGFGTSEQTEERNRPQLRVFFSPGTGVFPPTMLSPVVTPTSVQVRFNGQPSTTFTVQRKATLTGQWTNLGTATTDASGAGTYTDNAPTGNSGFYRIAYP